jgi:hypothetical protein
MNTEYNHQNNKAIRNIVKQFYKMSHFLTIFGTNK